MTDVTNVHEELYSTFCDWFSALKDHIDKWEPVKESSILVWFKTDGYFTDGLIYVFGKDEVTGKMFLHMMKED